MSVLYNIAHLLAIKGLLTWPLVTIVLANAKAFKVTSCDWLSTYVQVSFIIIIIITIIIIFIIISVIIISHPFVDWID